MANEFDITQFKDLASKFKLLTKQQTKYNKLWRLDSKIEYAYTQWVIERLEPIFAAGFNSYSVTKLQDFFLENEQFAKQNTITPTAIPKTNVMLFLCKVATAICGDKQPIQMLFSNINWESLNPEQWPHLNTAIPLEKIIRTHILSDDGKSLIPVSALLEDNFLEDYYQDTNKANKHYNYYNADFALISDYETVRLIRHSNTTQNMNDNLQSFYQLSEQSPTDLLTQLNMLCSALYIQSSGVRGSEYIAGKGAFLAIQNFHDYYMQLASEEINKIPEIVTSAIHDLFYVGGNYRGNMIANVDTCIATRRTKIVKAISGNEAILASISLSADTLNLRKAEVLSLKEQSFQRLRDEFANNTYNYGFDKYNIPPALLNELNIEFTIQNPQDQELLAQLDPDNIKALLVDNSNLSSINANAFLTLERFIEIANELSVEQFDAVLSRLQPFLSFAYIRFAPDMAALVMGINDNNKIDVLYNYFSYRDISSYISKEKNDWINELIRNKDFRYEIIQEATENSEVLFEIIRNIPEEYIRNSIMRIICFSIMNQLNNQHTSIKTTIKHLEFLISMGFDINSINAVGETPLMLAVAVDSPLLLRFLLNHGASVLPRTVQNQSAMSIAINLNRRTNFILLFEHFIGQKQNFIKLGANNYIELYTNTLLTEIISIPEKARFLNQIKFNETFIELIQIKKQCDINSMRLSDSKKVKISRGKSKVLNELIYELLQARRELCSNPMDFDSTQQKEFSDRCLRAVATALPELQKHRDTAGLIIKCILCIFIIPAIYFAVTGQFNTQFQFKTKSEQQADRFIDQLLRVGIFSPARNNNIDANPVIDAHPVIPAY